ncbi:MAG: tetratricopeptide repeat protein [Candidatus Helarchaeota archaeon]
MAYMKWFNEGNIHFQEERYDQAITCWEKALKIGQEENISQVVSKSFLNIGTAYGAKGDWKKALQNYYKSLEIEKEQGDEESIIECLFNIGDAFFALEEWENARTYYTQGLEKFVKEDRTKARILSNIGLSLFSEGKWNEARNYFEQSLQLFRELNDHEGISNCLTNLGVISRNLGLWEEAINYYRESLELDKHLNNEKGVAACLMNIGIALEVLGKLKEAIQHYHESLGIFRKLEDDQGIATCLINLGNAFEMLKKWDKALEFYQQSLKIFQRLGDKLNISKSLTNIGIALRNLGKWKEAIQNYQQSLTWFEKLKDRAARSKCLLDLGVAYHAIGKRDDAIKYFEESRKLFQKLGDRPGEALACQNLGWVYQESDNIQLAVKYFTEALGIYTTLITHISSEEYRKSYAREFETLPKIIGNLAQLLEQPITIERYIPTDNTEVGAKAMTQLLSELKNNITELNMAVQEKSSSSEVSQNISSLIDLVNRTLVTFSKTEKLKGEKIYEIIEESMGFIKHLFQTYELAKKGQESKDILEILIRIQNRLRINFPQLDFIPQLQEKIKQIQKEAPERFSEALAHNLRFAILSWIRGLYNISISNKKIYLETIGEPDDLYRNLEVELRTISNRIQIEEVNYSKDILGYLIITKKQAGIPIFQWNFIEATFDSDLVGGFLSAIQSFGSEITRESASMEKIAYKGFEINFQDGEFIRCALILKGEITKLLLKGLRNFVQEFESHFEKPLRANTGNVAIFETTDTLIQKYFDVSLSEMGSQ